MTTTIEQPITADEITEHGWIADPTNGDTTYDLYRANPSGSAYLAETISVWSDADTCVGWTITRAASLTLTNTAPEEITDRRVAQDYLDNQDTDETRDMATELSENLRADADYLLMREVA